MSPRLKLKVRKPLKSDLYVFLSDISVIVTWSVIQFWCFISVVVYILMASRLRKIFVHNYMLYMHHFEFISFKMEAVENLNKNLTAVHIIVLKIK